MNFEDFFFFFLRWRLDTPPPPSCEVRGVLRDLAGDELLESNLLRDSSFYEANQLLDVLRENDSWDFFSFLVMNNL